MRVALLTHNARAGDAIGNQVAEKVAFFLDRGADVRVFVEDGRHLHPDLRPHARTIDADPRGDTWDYLVTSDLVVVEYGQAYPALNLLPLLAGHKPRLLVDYHGVTPAELWEGAGEAVLQGARQRGVVWCADAAVVHSRFTRRELLEHTDFPAERVHQLGHAVETSFWRPGAPRQDLRRQLGLGPARLLLFVGRLAPNKRVPVLVDALARLKDLVPAVHAVVAGDGGDIYQAEAQRCRELAAGLGVGDRLHLLGHLSVERLRDAYRSADVFVMPSRHEGFCIPVVEALACGLPVVAARAGALPETLGDAGLLFVPDDADDLARQVKRLLCEPARDVEDDSQARATSPGRRRVAVVTYRYGTDLVGGAETSLRTIAEALDAAGHHVEVFTTCTRDESNWADYYPEGTVTVGGVSVHRFRLDRHDRARHLDAVRAVLRANGAVGPEAEQEYLAHSVHSGRLLDALARGIDGWDAVITGPYPFGLTHDVATAFPGKTLLLPCFHDEPFARLRAWRQAYARVGGLLYHSPEEQDLAEGPLGIHPARSRCCGTFLDTERAGDPDRGRALIGTGRPYVVYCGRYSPQKGVPALLEAARQYERTHPGRFTFVFLGEGNVAIPDEPWARDLGFVSEEDKRDVLAGAAALVQLSHLESLSLVALEAWAQGVPVLVNRRCRALVGHLQRGAGGRAVEGAKELAAALDDLADNPDVWRALGRRGQEYVCRQYGSRPAFTAVLEQAVESLREPLAAGLRRRGQQQAARHDRAAWRQRFGDLVEQLLDAPPRPVREQVEIVSRAESRTVAAGTGTVLVPVRVQNQGTHAALAEGQARFVLRCQVTDEAGQPCGVADTEASLPGLLMPGQATAAAVPVSVPAAPGVYRAAFRAERLHPESRQSARPDRPPRTSDTVECQPPASPLPAACLRLVVEEGAVSHVESGPGRCCTPLLDGVQEALAEADRLQRLPDDYVDVTEGPLARWKRWVKRKLLGNFKHAYLDVLSRQQSAFNGRVLAALNELAECCLTLDHVRKMKDKQVTEGTPCPPAGPGSLPLPPAATTDPLLQHLLEQLADSRRRCAQLEERLARLEARAGAREHR